jgi:hypothetical protein
MDEPVTNKHRRTLTAVPTVTREHGSLCITFLSVRFENIHFTVFIAYVIIKAPCTDYDRKSNERLV